jgi:hypothetical protein
MDRQARLADARHSVDGPDPCLWPTSRHISEQPRQLGLAAGEAADGTRQRPRRRSRRRTEGAQRRELGLQARGAHLEDLLRTPQVLQLVHAQINQRCARRKRIPHQGCRRLRNQDLATVPDRRHPRRAMHVQAHRTQGRVRRLTGMHPHPHPDVLPGRPHMTLKGLLHLHDSRHARPRRRERREEPVPKRVQLPATVPGQNRPDQRVMIGQQLRIHAFTHPPQQRR